MCRPWCPSPKKVVAILFWSCLILTLSVFILAKITDGIYLYKNHVRQKEKSVKDYERKCGAGKITPDTPVEELIHCAEKRKANEDFDVIALTMRDFANSFNPCGKAIQIGNHNHNDLLHNHDSGSAKDFDSTLHCEHYLYVSMGSFGTIIILWSVYACFCRKSKKSQPPIKSAKRTIENDE